MKFSGKSATRREPGWLIQWLPSLIGWAAVLVFSVPLDVRAQNQIAVQMQVRDAQGNAIVDARVTVTPANSSRAATVQTLIFTTDSNGSVSLLLPGPDDYSVSVTKSGFDSQEVRLTARPAMELQVVTLRPEVLAAQITVAAGRREERVADAAESVTILSRGEVLQSGAETVDDLLRSIPGFTLFRRTSSIVANPTTQGVSLRGLGPSGASRTAVLFDGVPLNDPFGGWVYWDRIPRAAIERIEVVRGGESDLYGTDALGGVISITPPPSDRPAVEADFSYGNLNTPNLTAFAAETWRGWDVALRGGAYRTDGYILLPESIRGPADVPANSRSDSIALRLGRQFSPTANLFADGQLFKEERNNGTPDQTNDTGIGAVAMGGEWADSLTGGSWRARVYGSGQLYHQTFSSVSANRATELLTRAQTSPSQQFGVNLQWERGFGSRVFTVAGIDGRQVRGLSDDLVFTAGRPTSEVSAGGRQRIIGLFEQTIVQITDRLSLTAGARFDDWRNFQADNVSRTLSNPLNTTIAPLADHSENAFSPKLALVYRLAGGLSIRGSVYKAFRAPTLNELYRTFRVGNVVTTANNNLRAERLTGGEGGLAYYSPDGRFSARSTGFWSDIVDPIANVTLTTTPALITRQRQNLGRTRSQGLELEAEWRVAFGLTLTGGYAFTTARVNSFSVDPTLVGKLVPQVPHNQITAQLRHTSRFLTASAQARFVSRQFDDDQNAFPLARFFVMDGYASHTLKRGIELFVAGENLFNTSYAVAATPLVTLGTPRLIRVGMRLHFGE